MAVIIWGLLLLVQLWTIFVTGSVTQSKICEADQITCLSTPDGVLFYINVELPGKAARKLLMETGTEESTINKFDQRTDLREEGRSFLLTPKTVAMAIPGMFLFSCILLCPCFRSRRKETANVVLAKDPISMDSASSLELSSASKKIPASPLPVPPSPQFSMFTKLSRLGLVHLNLSQVAKATHNFSPSLLVGEGGFGTVYKAQLQDGQIVAIKRTKTEHCEAQRTEFSNKIELLAKMEHRNLVKLHGYVDEGNEHIIITEFVPNGTLREHLDGQRGKILDFNQRLEISIDVSHALTYLHLYSEQQIIHRNVKSSNILLTERLRAKVADFGFARLGPMEADQTHILTKVKGTLGYLDPEYLKTYQLTPKSDVYSFGILLIEILTGRHPVEMKRAANERITVRWAFKKYSEGNMVNMLDPMMEEVVDAEILVNLFGLAFQCAAPTHSDRPNMKEVAEQLWGIRTGYLRSVKRGG